MSKKVLTDVELARAIGGMGSPGVAKSVAAEKAIVDGQHKKLYDKMGYCPCGGHTN
jgi:hypothetical protein